MIDRKTCVGPQIQKERERRGLSIEEFAKLCLMRPERINDYESGRVIPNFKSLNVVISALTKYDRDKDGKRIDDCKASLDNIMDNRYNFKAGHGSKPVITVPSSLVSSDEADCSVDTIVSFDPFTYTECYKSLVKGCNDLYNRMFKENKVDSECLSIVDGRIHNYCSSIEFQFKRSVVLSSGIDRHLCIYTIKNCLNDLMECYNKLHEIDYSITYLSSSNRFDRALVGSFLSHLKCSLHCLRFAINYINDFFYMEFNSHLLITKSSGSIYSLFEVEIFNEMMRAKEAKGEAV